jgi:hypothetical protein
MVFFFYGRFLLREHLQRCANRTGGTGLVCANEVLGGQVLCRLSAGYGAQHPESGLREQLHVVREYGRSLRRNYALPFAQVFCGGMGASCVQLAA